MSVHRIRRWSDIEPTMCECIFFVGFTLKHIDTALIPAQQTRSINPMRLRRWSIIGPASDQCLVFAGCTTTAHHVYCGHRLLVFMRRLWLR